MRAWLKPYNTSYWEAGSEICPKTERHHWQGWLYLKSARTLKSVGKGAGAHFEAMKGSHDQNTKYCGKDGLLLSEGTRPKQGHRTDLEEAVKCKTVRELFERQVPNFQTIRVLEKKLEYCENNEFREISIGHIEYCDLLEFDEQMEDTYVWAGDGWEGYDGQTRLLITNLPMGGIPRYLRRGVPHRVKTGGTSRMLRVTDVLIINT